MSRNTSAARFVHLSEWAAGHGTLYHWTEPLTGHWTRSLLKPQRPTGEVQASLEGHAASSCDSLLRSLKAQALEPHLLIPFL